MSGRAHATDPLDDTAKNSGPTAHTPTGGTGDATADGEEAKGTPHSDRQASETAAGRQEKDQSAEPKSH